jgi:predicted nucleic acid-binding protein
VKRKRLLDCFAAATAKKNNSVIMTGDPDFKKIEGLVAIE